MLIDGQALCKALQTQPRCRTAKLSLQPTIPFLSHQLHLQAFFVSPALLSLVFSLTPLVFSLWHTAVTALGTFTPEVHFFHRWWAPSHMKVELSACLSELSGRVWLSIPLRVWAPWPSPSLPILHFQYFDWNVYHSPAGYEVLCC